METKKFLRLISILLVMTLINSSIPAMARAASGTATLIDVIDVYLDKARYTPGDRAQISVDLKNENASSWNGDIDLDVYHLETLIFSDSLSASIPAFGEVTTEFSWQTPAADFTGYLVKVSVGDSFGTAGLDVSSDFTKFPRYGYVADYDENE
ncbi:MAG: glycoside hydrolase family 66 protein, partial [Clostridiales bacterium]|nr:glycoside hydrolase family 66 protein [Clostridiales bacterium]